MTASDPVVQSITHAGTIAWTVPVGVDHTSYGCAGAIGDAAGNSYVQAVDATGPYIESLDNNGAVRWRTASTYGMTGIQPKFGTDGTVYFMGFDGGSFAILGFAPSTGKQVLVIASSDMRDVFTYTGGLAAVSSGGVVSYYGYDGTLIKSVLPGSSGLVTFGAGSYAGLPDGTVFVAGWDRCDAGANRLYVAKVTPGGVPWVWTDGQTYPCGRAYVAATTDGGAVLNFDPHGSNPNDLGGSSTTVGLNATGSQRWVRSTAALVSNYLSNLPLVDTNGVVTLLSRQPVLCSDGTACIAVQVDSVKQDTGQTALPTLSLVDPGWSYDVIAAAIAVNRLYVVRQATYQAPPSLPAAATVAFDVLGMGADYRSSVQKSPTTPIWSVPMPPNGGAMPVPTPGGDVLAVSDFQALANQPFSGLQALTSAGSRRWQLPLSATEQATGAAPVVDSSGNTYVLVQGSGVASLASFDPSGNRRWLSPVPGECDHCLALGWNGSVFVGNRGGSGPSHVIGMSMATGVRTFDASFGDVTGLVTYPDGLGVVDSSSTVKYYSYDGALQKTVSGGSAVGRYLAYSSAGGGNGAVFLAGYSTSSCTASVEKIAPSGIQWTWTAPADTGCNQTFLAATPDGGVILMNGTGYTSLGPSGTTRWVSAPAAPRGTIVAGYPPLVDTSGNVVMPLTYDYATSSSPQNRGLVISFATAASASPGLAALVIEENSCDFNAGANFSQYYGIGVGSDQLYAGLVDGCSGSAPTSVQAFRVAGLRPDYRLALQPGGSVPSTTTTTTMVPTSTTTSTSTTSTTLANGNIRVTPSQGVQGTVFQVSYSCPGRAVATVQIFDANNKPVNRGATLSQPVVLLGRENVRTVKFDSVGVYTITLLCNKKVTGSASVTVTATVRGEGKYVALGDSFSAGEGTFVYDTNAQACHRGPAAWPRSLEADSDQLGPIDHRACTGAKTRDFYSPQPGMGVPAQIPTTPQLDVGLVTFTIGGNDADFSGLIQQCYLTTCNHAPDDSQFLLKLAELTATLKNTIYPRLVRAYPSARIVHIGYPRLTPVRGATPINCLWLDPDEQAAADLLVERINNAIRSAIHGQSRVEYADVTDALRGHELCTADSWVNEIDRPPVVGRLGRPNSDLTEQGHPNSVGQDHYETAVASALGVPIE